MSKIIYVRLSRLLLVLLPFTGVNADFVFEYPSNTVIGGQHFLPGWATNNTVHQIGTNFKATWSTDWPAYNIFISQLDAQVGFSGYEGSVGNELLFKKNASDTEPGGFEWNVNLYTWSLSTSNIFFFTAIDEAETNEPNTFGIFNVTEDAVTSASGAPGSSSTSSTSTPTSSKSSSSTASATSTPSASSASGLSIVASNTNTSSPSSHTSLELGLGIGLGIALLITAALAAALSLKVFRGSQQKGISSDDRYFQLSPPSVGGHTPEISHNTSLNRELPETPVGGNSVKPAGYELQG